MTEQEQIEMLEAQVRHLEDVIRLLYEREEQREAKMQEMWADYEHRIEVLTRNLR